MTAARSVSGCSDLAPSRQTVRRLCHKPAVMRRHDRRAASETRAPNLLFQSQDRQRRHIGGQGTNDKDIRSLAVARGLPGSLLPCLSSSALLRRPRAHMPLNVVDLHASVGIEQRNPSRSFNLILLIRHIVIPQQLNRNIVIPQQRSEQLCGVHRAPADAHR